MPAKDLGNKFVCYKCTTKFYDLKKPDPLCPKCGADQRESPTLKPASETKRSRLSAAKAVAPVEPTEVEPAAEEDEDSFEDEDAEDEAVDEDEDL